MPGPRHRTLRLPALLLGAALAAAGVREARADVTDLLHGIAGRDQPEELAALVLGYRLATDTKTLFERAEDLLTYGNKQQQRVMVDLFVRWEQSGLYEEELRDPETAEVVARVASLAGKALAARSQVLRKEKAGELEKLVAAALGNKKEYGPTLDRLAENLTALAAQRFSRVPFGVLVSKRRNQDARVAALAALADDLSNTVAASVLSEQNGSKRAKRVELFIDLGKRLLAKNDFFSARAVLAGGLRHHDAVSRLDEVGGNERLNAASQIFESPKNYSLYRRRVAELDQSQTLFLPTPLFLTDLEYTWEQPDDLKKGASSRAPDLEGKDLADYSRAIIAAKIVGPLSRVWSRLQPLTEPEEPIPDCAEVIGSAEEFTAKWKGSDLAERLATRSKELQK